MPSKDREGLKRAKLRRGRAYRNRGKKGQKSSSSTSTEGTASHVAQNAAKKKKINLPPKNDGGHQMSRKLKEALNFMQNMEKNKSVTPSESNKKKINQSSLQGVSASGMGDKSSRPENVESEKQNSLGLQSISLSSEKTQGSNIPVKILKTAKRVHELSSSVSSRKQLKNKLYWKQRTEKKEKKKLEKKLKKLGRKKDEDKKLETYLTEKNSTEKSKKDTEDADSDIELDDIDNEDLALDFEQYQDRIEHGEQAYQPPDLLEVKKKVKRRHDNMLKRIRNQQNNGEQDPSEEDEQKQVKERAIQLLRDKVIQNYKDNQLKRQKESGNPS